MRRTQKSSCQSREHCEFGHRGIAGSLMVQWLEPKNVRIRIVKVLQIAVVFSQGRKELLEAVFSVASIGAPELCQDGNPNPSGPSSGTRSQEVVRSSPWVDQGDMVPFDGWTQPASSGSTRRLTAMTLSLLPLAGSTRRELREGIPEYSRSRVLVGLGYTIANSYPTLRLKRSMPELLSRHGKTKNLEERLRGTLFKMRSQMSASPW